MNTGDDIASNAQVDLATPQDHQFLVDCNQAMAMETEHRRLDGDRLAQGVLAVLNDPQKGRYYVVRVQGRPVACLLITFEWSDWRNALFWWIQSVYVVPEARRVGAFRALYRAVENEAAACGACGLRLYVEQDNQRAQETYAALGMNASHYRMFEREF